MGAGLDTQRLGDGRGGGSGSGSGSDPFGINAGTISRQGQGQGDAALAQLTGLPWVARPGVMLLLELMDPSASIPLDAGSASDRRGITNRLPGTPGSSEADELGRPVAWGYLRLIAPDGSPRIDLSCDAEARHLDVGQAPEQDQDQDQDARTGRAGTHQGTMGTMSRGSHGATYGTGTGTGTGHGV